MRGVKAGDESEIRTFLNLAWSNLIRKENVFTFHMQILIN